LNAAPALQDDELEDFLQSWVSGVTGMDGTLVRPRWQPEPPNIPDFNIDWCALGITRTISDTFVWIGGTDPNSDELQRHQVMDVLVTFYGPHCSSNSGRLRDGVMVPQNREILLLNDMGLVEVGDTVRVPEQLKGPQGPWTDREDLTIRVRRRIVRHYAVLSILEAEGTVTAATPDGRVFTAAFDAGPVSFAATVAARQAANAVAAAGSITIRGGLVITQAANTIAATA
jgi:hypothetical protein